MKVYEEIGQVEEMGRKMVFLGPNKMIVGFLA
jgi:hypothetical protein